MDIQGSKSIGIAFAVSAEASGLIDVLRQRAKEVGCTGAEEALQEAAYQVSEAGKALLGHMQALSGDAYEAAREAAVNRMAGG